MGLDVMTNEAIYRYQHCQLIKIRPSFYCSDMGFDVYVSSIEPTFPDSWMADCRLALRFAVAAHPAQPDFPIHVCAACSCPVYVRNK